MHIFYRQLSLHRFLPNASECRASEYHGGRVGNVISSFSGLIPAFCTQMELA
jgi:hypothetical protein